VGRAALLLSLICLAAGPAGAELPFGFSVDLTLTHDSELRSYDVLRPLSSAGPPAALVVDLHGFGSDGDEQRGISGWSTIAGNEGFLVAWPDGLDSSWNGITCCGNAVSNDVDDVGFMRAMLAAIQAEANVDPQRIYVTGLSNGGAMSHRLACEAADLFAAAAPMAFPVPYPDFPNECQPSRVVPLLLFMGLTDSVVSYAGAAPSYAAWRDKNACDSGGAVPEIDESYGGSDCSIDTSCGETGVQVGLCSVTGSDFDPPLEGFNGHILYINDDAFDISQRAWDFMRVHSTDAPGVPALSSPLVLWASMAAAGSAALAQRRLRRRARAHVDGSDVAGR